jgi:hypothetical protein
MATNVELKKLIESLGRGILPTERAKMFGANPFTDITGFHIYGELNLTLKLTAASEVKDAQKLLRILQEYTLIAEACATESSAVLLEVQGERIHLLIPTNEVSPSSLKDLLEFCISFTSAVYSRISKAAGKDFQGFKMAADHGRAILAASGNQANGSVVSLGPAANAPAKELKRNGKAAHLRMRAKHFKVLFTSTSNESEWINIPVLEPTDSMSAAISNRLTKIFEDASGLYIKDLPENPKVLFAGADFLNSFSGGYVNQAVKVQGFSLRADLDGFSKQVEAAFLKGNDGIVALIQRFFKIMEYPSYFRTRLGKTIDLPWAGDCATVIVLVSGSSYEDAREYLPVKAAAEWHSDRIGIGPDKRKWSDFIGEASWAVGIAGGDSDEGEGYVLIAPIAGRHRDFLVAAGWNVGRSLDAQETDGVTGEDTVIHNVDYVALDSIHKKSFKVLNSQFWISHGLTANSLRSTGIGNLATQGAIFVPNIPKPVPQAKPWYEAA